MNLSEIRQQNPQYNVLSDDELARSLHEKFYAQIDFKDFSKRIGYLKGAQPDEYDPASKEWQDRWGPTRGMSGGEKFIAGAQGGLANIGLGLKKAWHLSQPGGVGDYVIDNIEQQEKDRLDKPLMSTGAGKAGSITGTVAAGLPLMAIPGANTVGGAALIGAGLGALQPSQSPTEMAKNTLVGGALGPAGLLAGRGIAATYGAGKAVLDPFLKSGQQRIAERTFQSFAGGADKAAEAARSIRQGLFSDVLPGVQPTTAELANNAGIAQLERTLKNNPEAMQAFSDRAASNRTSIMDAIEGIAGDDAGRAAAHTARKAATDPLYEAATKATYKVDEDLANLLQRPAVQQAMKRAETLAANQGRPFSFSTTSSNAFAGAGMPGKSSQQVTGQGLQDLKMAMDEMLSDPASGFSGKAGDTIKSLRGKLLDWMENANPDFKAARTQYAELSKPLSQMDIGQTLRDKLVPAIADYGATTPLRGPAFAQAMRNGDATAAQAMGRPYGSMADVMTPPQMDTLRQVGEQLARRTNADALGRAVGSNTGQNIASQNVLRQFLGPLGLPQSMTERAAGSTLMQTLMRPAQFTAKLGEERILAQLTQIGLDPKRAAQVLEAAKQKPGGLVELQAAITPVLVSGANAAKQH